MTDPTANRTCPECGRLPANVQGIRTCPECGSLID